MYLCKIPVESRSEHSPLAARLWIQVTGNLGTFPNLTWRQLLTRSWALSLCIGTYYSGHPWAKELLRTLGLCFPLSRASASTSE